jgi:nitroimidazol reductase NimA-like FMN-containing flavoprotein (pyridoxamine 5'-phosphate oxidase superfamily)
MVGTWDRGQGVGAALAGRQEGDVVEGGHGWHGWSHVGAATLRDMSREPSDIPQPPVEALRVRRSAKRARYDRETIDAIIDATLIAHVGTVRDGKPIVVPMLCRRDGDWLLLHGSPAAGTLLRGRDQEVCVTFTQLDGLVLARSAFHHSLNYRSVIVLGTAELVRDEAERALALERLMEGFVPGRQATLRPTTPSELRQTAVLRVSLATASAKLRNGPPADDEDDYGLPIWAGVLPVTTTIGEPQADPRLAPGIDVPEHVRRLVGRDA